MVELNGVDSRPMAFEPLPTAEEIVEHPPL
jgi:hypothetical protein